MNFPTSQDVHKRVTYGIYPDNGYRSGTDILSMLLLVIYDLRIFEWVPLMTYKF